jgi:DNA polymerase III epsilon subunit family exonuclease
MPFSLLDPLDRLPLVFFDTETTGTSPAWGHRVIEIGIVRVEGGRVTGEYQQLIDPGRFISPFITRITGITPDMLRGQPTFADVLDHVAAWFEGAVVLGHNVDFDLSFLRSEFERAQRPLEEALGEHTLVMDTLRIARRRFGRGGNSLGKLAGRLGVMPVEAHRALADAHTTRGVFERLMEPVGGGACCLCDALMQQGGPIRLGARAAAPRRQTPEIGRAMDF